MSTLYEVLGVAQDATTAEMKKAFHALMLIYHPDKNPNASEERKTKYKTKSQEANNAWEILRNPERRQEYDDLQSRPAKRQRYNDFDPDNQPSSFSESGKHTPPPKKYPRTLEIASHGWVMSAMIRGNYEPYDWGQGCVYCDENRILIYMKIREAEHGNPLIEPDVRIEIWSTPESRRVRNIESLYKHRMQPEGVDEQLFLTVS